MPASSLLTLLDDMATTLDDVAAMTKTATQKTAVILGDDLAVNAEQVSGVQADRELPVVWAVARGSAINRAILVPAGLLMSALAPVLVAPLLMALRSPWRWVCTGWSPPGSTPPCPGTARSAGWRVSRATSPSGCSLGSG